MNIAFITCGLPGPAYHGGAVTCWALLKTMLACGHRVTLISLFDDSPDNPYLDSKEKQRQEIKTVGADLELINFFKKDLILTKHFSGIKGISQRISRIYKPNLQQEFYWAGLAPRVDSLLQKKQPQAIFCYHFDSLSAVYQTKVAPLMAGVGDLWHLPSFFRWRIRENSPRKYFREFPQLIEFYSSAKKLMLQMLRSCKKRGAFAAHYAAWLRNHKGCEDTLYLRTPAHDPVGPAWKGMREVAKLKNHKPRILMIGDITGTAAKWGLRLLIREVLPVLEKSLGQDGFEIHLVGAGEMDPEFKILHEKSYLKIRGRVTPPDQEFLSSDLLFVPTPITLGIRVRIITGMSYGCCIITHTANTAGIPEVEHEKNALVADTGKKLAEQIIRCLQDVHLREKIEENARRTFEKYFSEKTAAGRIVKEIETLSKVGEG